MSSAANLKNEEIRNYLLRRLPEKDLDRIEAAYFSDDSLFDRIEAEEDRMIAEYVMGQMPPPDRRRFEDSLLAAPYYRERVETTRRIQLQLSKRAVPSPPARAASERLFPGRTGAIVLSGLGGLLLISAVVSALYLRGQVAVLRGQVQERSSSVHRAPRLLDIAASIPVAPAVPEGPGLVRLPRDRNLPLQLTFPGRVLPPAAGRRYVEAVDSSGRSLGRVEASFVLPEGRSLSLTLNSALLSNLPLEIELVTEQAAGRVRVPLARLEEEPPPSPPSP
ncbi:MAG: hypothetical protein DIJKHBIC_04022 [Thermoanaerobaculia bacterium]|nr:hypothetical protein [Thermoanaerobaculia bacterium]